MVHLAIQGIQGIAPDCVAWNEAAWLQSLSATDERTNEVIEAS